MWHLAAPLALAAPPTALSPDLAFTGLDGQRHTVGELAGKVVLLDFWATWCEPCKRSLPTYRAWQAELGEKGFVVVAVSVDETTKPIARFVEATCPDVTVWWDEGHDAAEALSVAAMPTAFLLGRDGAVALRHEGFEKKDADVLRAEVERLLAR
jgi:thiol-disulfide isomerase/thioredoxin